MVGRKRSTWVIACSRFFPEVPLATEDYPEPPHSSAVFCPIAPCGFGIQARSIRPKRYCPTDSQPTRSFPAYSTEQFQEYRLHAQCVSSFAVASSACKLWLRVSCMACIPLHRPVTQSTILCIGKDLHSHGVH